MAIILSGELVLDSIKNQISYGETPCLGICLSGTNQSSEIYVRKKQEACKQVGIKTILERPDNPIDLIHSWNKDKSVHGILVQLPLPTELDRTQVLSAIDPKKDVDCLTPENCGLLFHGKSRFLPCTPAGVLEIFNYYNILTEGKKIVLIGRSLIIGQPLMAILSQPPYNATISVCHEFTNKIESHTKCADIIISAVGRPEEFRISKNMISENCVLIDIGISRIGNRIVGDVHDECWDKAKAVTPVPGGCGPATIGCLLKNVVKASER